MRFQRLRVPNLRAAKTALAFEAMSIRARRGSGGERQEMRRKRRSRGGAAGNLIPTHQLDGPSVAAGVKIVDLLASADWRASKSAARRLVEQGGVRVGDSEIATVDDTLRADEIGTDGVLLHAGKKHVRRIVVG